MSKTCLRFQNDDVTEEFDHGNIYEECIIYFINFLLSYIFLLCTDIESELHNAKRRKRGSTSMKKFGVNLTYFHIIRFDVII